MAMEAFFLPVAAGQRFCLLHGPEEEPARGGVVFVHPFAEEMNKSRRMAALQSRAFARAGYRVLQMDLLGCGDSSGDFGDAAWGAWVEDVRLAAAWLRQRVDGPLWLWGLRAGCLVAAEAARALGGPVNLLFWHPTPSGSRYLQQFLRLKTAGSLQEADGKGATEKLRHELATGESVEVAGYRVSPALAEGMAAAELAPSGRPGRVEWLELTSQAEANLAPASRKCLDAWAKAGHRTRGQVVSGQQFWQTVETTECPALVEATLAALEEQAL